MAFPTDDGTSGRADRVDGRWSQHTTSLYGQFQKAIGWTTEDMEAVIEALTEFRS